MSRPIKFTVKSNGTLPYSAILRDTTEGKVYTGTLYEKGELFPCAPFPWSPPCDEVADAPIISFRDDEGDLVDIKPEHAEYNGFKEVTDV